MKKFTTFLLTMVLAIVCSVSAFAQPAKPTPTFVPMATDGTAQYLYNADAVAFWTNGNDWGTRGTWSATTANQFKIVAKEAGFYELQNQLTNGNWMSAFIDWTGNIYMDNGTDPNCVTWQIASLGDNKYEFTNTAASGKKVGINQDATTIVTMTNQADAYTTWGFISVDDFEALSKAAVKYREDYTAWKLANLEIGDEISAQLPAWYVPEGRGNKAPNTGSYSGATENFFEGWLSEGPVIYKHMEGLAAGAYEIDINAVCSSAWFGAPTGEGIVQLYANDVTVPLTVYNQTGCTWTDSKYNNVITAIVGEDGVLEVGLKNIATGGNWYVVNINSATYVANADLAPYLGEVTVTPEDDANILPENCNTIDFDVTFDKMFKSQSVYEVTVSGTTSANGSETPFTVTGIAGNTLSIDASEYAVAGTEVTVNVTSVEVYDTELDKVVISETMEETSAFKVATLTEVAIANYEKAIKEANAHFDTARQHMGVGVMLYLPADVAKYAENLDNAIALGSSYSIYNDYVEGEGLIRSIMMECRPQFPNSNQRYTIKNKATGYYMSVEDDAVTLEKSPTPVAFHHVEGAMEDATFYMYSTPDKKYVFNADAKGTLKGQTTKLALGQWQLVHNCAEKAYAIVGKYGAIGADNEKDKKVPALSAVLAAKYSSEDANSQWILEEYEEPAATDPVDVTKIAGKFTSPQGSVGTVANWAWNEHEGCAEIYNGGGAIAEGDVLVQNLTGLDNGLYIVTLEVGASYTSGRGFEANTGKDLAEVFANEATEGIEVYDRSSLGANDGDVITLEADVTDGTLSFGIRNISAGGNWYLANVVSIMYVADGKSSGSSSSDDATAIASASATATPVAVYSANGAQLKSAQKGLNVVKYSDGSVRKVLVK